MNYRNIEKDGEWVSQRKVLGIWIKIPDHKSFPTQREAQTFLNTYIRNIRK